MLNWIRKLWEEDKRTITIGLIVTVVGGLILSAFISQRFQELVIKSLDKIQVEVTLPFYWLPIIFALGALVIRLLIWRANKKSESYLMDEIQGLVWEWDYFQTSTSDSPPYNLTALCPQCLAKLPITDTTCHYQCPSCSFEKDCSLTHENLMAFVKTEIEKREKTGDWKLAKNRIKKVREN